MSEDCRGRDSSGTWKERDQVQGTHELGTTGGGMNQGREGE